jgi:hypothetical protein
MRHMLSKGIFKKGKKKTVNDVPCRVWLVDVVEYGSGLEGRTVCLGLNDHLPYEVTSDYDHSRTTFSDFNAAIEVLEPPASIASDTGTTAGSIP